MKKLFIGIIIFAIIAFLTTGLLISQKNNAIEDAKNNISGESNLSGNTANNDSLGNFGEDTDENNTQQIAEKTIDLYGTYDENDLKINDAEENVNILGKNIKVNFKQIEGLKNKEVENKINNEIKTYVIEKVEEISEKSNPYKTINIYSNIIGNFANVLSLEINFNYYVEDKFETDEIFLNYELITGKQLSFEDLFTKDADLHSIVRKALYKRVIEDETVNYLVNDIKFDKEKNEWIATYWEHDESTGIGKEVEKTYIPELTDYEINKKLKKYINYDNKNFSFSPRSIRLEMDDEYYYSVDFIDIADEVVIYDKFLMNESLFEKQDIGMKNIWTCSIPYNYDEAFFEYGFATENLFYEIRNWGSSYNDNIYPFSKSLETINKNILKQLSDELKTYTEIAKQNLDKFYIVSLSGRTDREYAEDINDVNRLISKSINKNVNYVDISLKKQVLDSILECYRYHNVGFYISGLSLFFEGIYSPIVHEDIFKELENKRLEQIYDARNLNEITDVKDVFRKNVDYMSLLQEKLNDAIYDHWELGKLNLEEKQKLIQNAKYHLELNGLNVTFNDRESTIFINYDKFHPSVLNIYDLNMFIIEYSKTRIYEKWELQHLSLDDLNKAYNEIFARHGHEFKTKELKEYFENLYWYNPIAGKTVTLEELSDIERQNLETIKELINEKKNAQ